VSIFVDTSALIAVLNAADDNHAQAAAVFRTLVEEDEAFVTTSYVLVETTALIQHRFGMSAVRSFQNDVAPLFDVIWVSSELHVEGIAALLTAGRRDLSLVDCVSFASMRRHGISHAFHFDHHFREQGFHDAG